jgi:hypothetical protein
MPGEAHGHLRHVLFQGFSFELRGEHGALFLLHAEQSERLLDAGVDGIREERSQLSAAPQACRQLVQRGEEGVHARVRAPCLA